MIPKSVSPTALETAEDCLAKYHAHSILRGDGFSNPAALLGTTLHTALDSYVTPENMANDVWDFGILKTYFVMAFYKHFQVIDTEGNEWFEQGLKILENWFNRRGQLADIKSGTIIDKELKQSFDVPYMLNGDKNIVPLNYIIDRLDRISDTEYRVVDYKSQRMPLDAAEMRTKLQVRIYALAVQIRYPQATRIWVQLDFLRYQAVSIALTKADNANTWFYIKKLVQKIVDTDGPTAPETLGAGCQYCCRKFTCASASANIAAGGIIGLSIDDLVAKKAQLDGQIKAQKGLIDDIEARIYSYLNEEDLDQFGTPAYDVLLTSKSKRYVNTEAMIGIIGSELAAQLGHINVGDIDGLKKDDRLTDSQKSLLSTAIEVSRPSRGLKITPVKRIDG